MHFPRRYAPLAAAVVSVIFLVNSCGESKIAQCNKLITIANKGKTFTVPKDPTGLVQIADSLDSLKTEILAVKIEDEKLKGFQTRFAEFYAEVSQSARNISKAATDKDRAALVKASKASQEITNKGEPLVDEINQYCAS